ncbi:4-hydroxy-tetrahydrodipicolinate synthase [Streptomyces sp. RB5]|uniref:4-hydroxy-tetrahydrodipicolinate synthase n=1 Tax=Streptomyces smaragdinus TaxID=2585196 RepID=A0A7K0CG11_9ACTN|nr:4-hydroxy-tetrahydrodipicolinate synthase [Streptomyces smaragdinus]MQY12336.1 4-hydroxy-tetrahydrodipicolinate synthase [Streptomyces smaragdinus]
MSTDTLGRRAAAMITPFTADGALDLAGAQRLAAELVDGGGLDALVLSGTTGESPTTSDAEKSALVRAVAEAVGDRASLIAGVGTSDTRHTVELARAAEAAGADGLLVVAPYYSRPGEEAIRHHFRTVADATGLPVLLYDIPGRTGSELSYESLVSLAAHPRIAGVKDCSYDLLKASRVLAATDLAYYAGCDEQILALRAIGAAGFISTVANVAPREVVALLDAYETGAVAEAARRHLALTPLIDAVMNAGVPGTVTAKALLTEQGLPSGPVRPPLLAADPALVEGLRRVAPWVSAVGY